MQGRNSRFADRLPSFRTSESLLRCFHMPAGCGITASAHGVKSRTDDSAVDAVRLLMATSSGRMAMRRTRSGLN